MLYSGASFSVQNIGVRVTGHFAERHFAESYFAERHFAERTFCRTDILLIGHFNERTVCRSDKIEISSELCWFAYTIKIYVIKVIVDFDDRNFDSKV
jgi:hypothetical protein